jgi:hypothetical protein
MDKDSFAKKASKTLGSRDIIVTTTFVSAEYCQPPSSVREVRTSETGHLQLLRIEPNRADLPSFSVRWDHKDNSVDIDLISINEEEVACFKAEKLGYRGHHTDKLDLPSRKYLINIETPATGPVFRGTLTLNIDLAILVTSRVVARVEYTANCIPSTNTSVGFANKNDCLSDDHAAIAPTNPSAGGATTG